MYVVWSYKSTALLVTASRVSLYSMSLARFCLIIIRNFPPSSSWKSTLENEVPHSRQPTYLSLETALTRVSSFSYLISHVHKKRGIYYSPCTWVCVSAARGGRTSSFSDSCKQTEVLVTIRLGEYAQLRAVSCSVRGLAMTLKKQRISGGYHIKRLFFSVNRYFRLRESDNRDMIILYV